MSENWNRKHSFIDVLRKLQELSLRAMRIDIALRMARTEAAIKALAPSTPEKEKSNG